MAILMPVALLSSLVMTALSWKRSTGFALSLAGLVLMISALVITLAIEVPIDNQIKVWTVTTLPSDWQALRDRWEFYHGLRTFVSIAALALVTASSLRTRQEV